MENGINLRYIQELFEHQSVQTADCYMYGSRRGFEQIQNLLDRMYRVEMKKRNKDKFVNILSKVV